MRVALVHDALINRGGAERVFQVFCEMFPDAPVYTALYFPKRTYSYFERRRIYTTPLQKVIRNELQFKKLFPLALWHMQNIGLHDFDLVLSSSTFCGKYVKANTDVFHICYCHQPFRLIWNPQSYSLISGASPLKLAFKFVLPFFRKWECSVVRRIQYFIANSEVTKGEIKRFYKQESVVISPPIKSDDYCSSSTTEEYFLVVSRLETYKRVDLVIAAFNKLRIPLKIVGDGTQGDRLRSIAGKGIEFLGIISEEKLKILYAKCQAVIFPQKEDFGIVALEANACGRPVICYGKGGVETTMIPYSEENKSQATALFFDDQTVESLVSAIQRFNIIEFNQQALVENAGRFDVSIFKEKMLETVEKICYGSEAVN